MGLPSERAKTRCHAPSQQTVRVAISEAVRDDLPQLVALNEPETAHLEWSRLREFNAQKLQAYLNSPHSFLLVARVGRDLVGYVSGVINPDFAAEMRSAPEVARQLWAVLTGRHGWSLRHLSWVARRAYSRLCRDPSCRLALPGGRGRAKVGWLNNLIVAKEWRGKGVAGQLLAAVEPWLTDRNVGLVGGDVLCRNVPSVRMLAKAGYQPMGAPMLRDGAEVQIVIKELDPW